MEYTATGRPVPRGPFSLGKPLSEVYQEGEVRRELVLERARQVARVTIPSLVPPLGYQEGDKLYTPHQSVGAQGVNNLASRLLTTYMPPGQPIFRHQIPEPLVAEFEAEDEEVLSKVTLALAKRALQYTSRMEATTIRSVLTEALRLLIVAGNCLFDYRLLDEPAVHQMSSYVVKRSKSGKQLLVILKQEISWQELPEYIQQQVQASEKYRHLMETDEWSRTVPVYTCCNLRTPTTNDPRKSKWETWQECADVFIQGSDGIAPYEAPPLKAMWMVPAYGFDWGRAYADEYIGDLITVENFSKATTDAAAAAAFTLGFVKPGRTRIGDVKSADNLDFISGSAEDVNFLRTEKGGDFNFVSSSLDKVIQRLAKAFLLISSIQRDAERVTAEEIRLMAQELDAALGGLHSILADDLQGYVVRRSLYMMERDGELKKLPNVNGSPAARIKITTGLDALGNSREVETLDALVMPLLEIDAKTAAGRINIDDYARRKAALTGVDPQGLIRTPEQVAASASDAKGDMMRKLLIEKGAGPAINQMGQLAKGAMDPNANIPAQEDLPAVDPDQLQQLISTAQEQLS